MVEGKPGRISLLTPELQATICKFLAEGNTRTDAAVAAGIGGRTFFKWMRLGRLGEDAACVQFERAVKKAESEATRRNIGIIQTAAKTHWQAAAWWLERKYPDKWGRDTGQIAELRKQLEMLEKRLGGAGPASGSK